MSRSNKRDKYILLYQKTTNDNKNPNHHIWKKKNGFYRCRFIQLYCPIASYCDTKGTWSSHKTNPDGRHIVSGIIRMKLKEEARAEINRELYE